MCCWCVDALGKYEMCRIESDHEVTIIGGLNEFAVKFYGPKDSESIIDADECTQ